jgi:hypothetical protein
MKDLNLLKRGNLIEDEMKYEERTAWPEYACGKRTELAEKVSQENPH